MIYREGRYSFFQHRECEYFPCHETEDVSGFNCLFCFCPLYALGERCGGNYRYGQDGVKDCRSCGYPHRRENYSKITERFRELAELAARTSEKQQC